MTTATKRDPRWQGDQGERSAMTWLLERGYPVLVPIGHSPDYDLVSDFGAGLVRIQCKTSSVYRKGRWDITTCTRGGNQSWGGMVKRLEAARYDQLFVLVGDGRRWLIPSGQVGGGCGVRLGGPKYAAFEIEPGGPLRDRPLSLH